jgi:uncharacterized protein (DUF885 family)
MIKVLISVIISGLIFSSQVRADEEKTLDDTNLNDILSLYTESYVQLNQFSALYYGPYRFLDQFGDYMSAAYMVKERALNLRMLKELEKINPKNLSPARLQTYQIFKLDMDSHAQVDKYPWEYLAFNQMNERLRDFIELANTNSYSEFPFDSFDHYQDFIKRARGLTHFVDGYIELHREGLRRGIIQNCVIGKKALSSIEEGAETDVQKSPFAIPLHKFPEKMSSTEQETLKADFKTVITEVIAPQYKRFIDFYKTEYLPHCRTEYGLASFPQSKEWYDADIYQWTSTKMTAEEIHQKGLDEVARIEKELEKIKTQTGFSGTLKEFFEKMKNDPTNYYTSREEMVGAFNTMIEKIRKILPQYFLDIPDRKLVIVEDTNPNQPAARYDIPTENRPDGWFLLNTSNLHSSQKAETTSLTLHEGIPGHHLQFSIALDKKDTLTNYERNFYYANSFIEGWALYSERLGNEMGLYTDPIQKYGNLNEEMLRAVRLVVDTGIHHYNWSREKVLEFMNAHLASDASAIETEADRYAAWPGQALGYKVGQLKILALRHEAETKLGSKFNLKEFHDIVLKNGPVTLEVLETNVHSWISSK